MSGAALFMAQARAVGLSLPTLEHRFAAPRRWRFDLAWPEQRVALEIEGGVWTGGRHTRPQGFLGDIEKYNAAAELGWRVLRCTPDQVRTGHALALMERVLGGAP